MTKRQRERKNKLQNAKNKRNRQNGVRFECPKCKQNYSHKHNMLSHFYKYHADVSDEEREAYGIKPKGTSPLKKPDDVPLTNDQWQFLKGMVRANLQHDAKRSYPSPFADYVKALKGNAHNLKIHELTRQLYHWWRAQQPEGFDMIGGSIPLELEAHATWQLSADRIDNSNEHYVNGEFDNLRMIPLKFNTTYSFVQEFGDRTRAKLRELYLAPKKEEVNVDSWVEELRQLPNVTTKNIAYRLYHSAINDTKDRCKLVNQPVPKPLSYEQFFEEVFAVALRRQNGRCAITTFAMNKNYIGKKCFKMSLDRIDSANLSYWDPDNVQIVCCAMNATDCKRQQVYEVNGVSAWSPAFFRQYIGV